MIICLGESVVALGVGVGDRHAPLTAGLVLGAGLALLITVGLWWTYFDATPGGPRRGCASTPIRCWPPPTATATSTW